MSCSIDYNSFCKLKSIQPEEEEHMFRVMQKMNSNISSGVPRKVSFSNNSSFDSNTNNDKNSQNRKNKSLNSPKDQEILARKSPKVADLAPSIKTKSILGSEKNYSRKASVFNKQKGVSTEIREEILYSIVDDIHSRSEFGLSKKTTRKLRFSLSILMTINILLSIVDNEIFISNTNVFFTEHLNKYKIDKLDPSVLKQIQDRVLSPVENTIRYINGVIILISMFLILLIFKRKAERLRLSQIISENQGIFSPLVLKQMLVELLLCSIYLPPHLNIVFTGTFQGNYWTYSLNSIFSLVIMIKIYFFLKLLVMVSKYTSDSASTVCRKYNVKSGMMFALKCNLKQRPLIVLGFLMGFMLLICSFTLRTFEFGVRSPDDKAFIGNNPLQSLANCFFFIFFSMTTVGYGDFVPQSLLGRIIAIISMIVGNIILALIIASLSILSEFNVGEKKAYSKLKKLFAVDNAMIKAGTVLKAVFSLRNTLNQNVGDKNGKANSENEMVRTLTEKFINFTQLKRDVSIFKNDYKIAKSLSLPLDETLKYLDKNISTNLNSFADVISSYDGAEDKINEVLSKSLQCKEQLKEIVKMQNEIAKYLIENNNNNLTGNKSYDEVSHNHFIDKTFHN